MNYAANCNDCGFATCELLFNKDKKRICPQCLQRLYNESSAALDRSFKEMYKMKKANEDLEIENQAYAAVLEHIKGLTGMVKEIKA